MEIRNVSVLEALEQLGVKYNEFMDLLDELSISGELGRIDELVSIGHWGMGKGLDVKEHFGISSEHGQLFHAQGDNIEGSLYTAFNGSVLRIRWAGHVALYLNSTANYMQVKYSRESGRYTLEPGRFNDEPIIRIEERGVVVEDWPLREYTHQVWMLRMDYEDHIRQARTLPNKVVRMITHLFGQEAAEPSLILPPPPALAYRSIEELVSVIDTMRDGIERTIDILAPYVAPTALEHR